jgi:hypothetical protein
MNEELGMIIPDGDNEIEVIVSYDIAPEEKEVKYDSNMTGHPYSPACIEYLEVYHEGNNITKRLSEKQISIIEAAIWEEKKNEAEWYN